MKSEMAKNSIFRKLNFIRLCLSVMRNAGCVVTLRIHEVVAFRSIRGLFVLPYISLIILINYASLQ